MSNAPAALLLIDASGWLFRAFHGLPPLSTPQGEPSGAVFGFASMLKRLYRDYAVDHIAVVFDASGRSFRNDLYPEYKANRSETPEDLAAQFPLVLDLVRAHGLPLIMAPDVEADDVIGTLAKQGEAAGMRVLIITSDKDMAQLVNANVQLLDTMKNRLMDEAGVQEKFGVRADQIIDYLALMGDASDNIPGVRGVGEKTAAKLLAEHGNLDAVMAAAPSIKGKLGENLVAALPILPLCKTLTTIKCDVPDLPALDALRKSADDPAALFAFYRRMGFGRFSKEAEEQMRAAGLLPAEPAAPAAAAPATAAAEPLAPTRPPSAPTKARMVLTAEDLAALVEALSTAELICFDTETDGLDSNACGLVGLAFATVSGEGWYVPLAHSYMDAPAQLPLQQVLDAVRPALTGVTPKLAQHGKFDCNVLVRFGLEVAPIAFDTMLESYVLDAAANRHDMDTLAEKYLGHSTIKFEMVAGKGKSFIGFAQVAVDSAAAYSAEDADITLRLHHTLYPQLVAKPSLLQVFQQLEMPLVPVLAGMEQTGVAVDTALLGRISQELGERMEQLQSQAFEAAGTVFNLGSPKQLGELLYGKLGLPVLGKTPKGEPSTAEDVLEDLAGQHPLPRLILDWRSLQKLRSTYTDTLPKQVNPRTGRIHTSYHQAVAATGRLSSQEPNLQNIPVRTVEGRRIRQAFVAPAGRLLCSIDYSQIELRLMAHFSGDEKLIAAFQQGLDIHQATAAEANHVALEAVTAEMRRAAKAINFGLIYGISAFGLARQLAIGRGEAQQTIDRFFDRYPGVRAFMESTKQRARIHGYVETLFGRRLELPNILSKNQGLRQYAERTAINAPLQGTAADLIKLAMIDVAALLKAEAPEVRMIMQVHDELVFEGPEAQMTGLAPKLAQCMVAVLQRGERRPAALAVPLVADFGLGANWDAAHTATGHVSS